MSTAPQYSNRPDSVRYNLLLSHRAQTYLYGVTDDVTLESIERVFDAFGEYMLCYVHGMDPNLALRTLILEDFIDGDTDLKRTRYLFDMALLEMRGGLDHLRYTSQQQGFLTASITLRPVPKLQGECAYYYSVFACDGADLRDNPYGGRVC